MAKKSLCLNCGNCISKRITSKNGELIFNDCNCDNPNLFYQESCIVCGRIIGNGVNDTISLLVCPDCMDTVRTNYIKCSFED